MLVVWLFWGWTEYFEVVELSVSEAFKLFSEYFCSANVSWTDPMDNNLRAVNCNVLF